MMRKAVSVNSTPSTALDSDDRGTVSFYQTDTSGEYSTK